MREGLIADPNVEDRGRAGTVNLPYARMVELLGSPNAEDDPHKTDAAWGIRDSSGAGFYVWNYKNGPRYTGKGTVEGIGSWSIGFPDPDVGNRTRPGDARRDRNRDLARSVFGAALDLSR
jgi:hypothetical protein